MKKCSYCHQDNPFRCKSCKFCNESSKKRVGRPKGTTASAGYNVGRNGGRPLRASEAEGYVVPKAGRRTSGSTEAEGYGVGKAGGRPTGSTEAEGYGVGKAGGVYINAQSNIHFDDSVDLPNEWETDLMNVSEELLLKCSSRIAQQ